MWDILVVFAVLAILTFDHDPVGTRVEDQLHLVLGRANIDRSNVQLIVKVVVKDLVVDAEPVLLPAKFLILDDLLFSNLLSLVKSGSSGQISPLFSFLASLIPSLRQVHEDVTSAVLLLLETEIGVAHRAY